MTDPAEPLLDYLVVLDEAVAAWEWWVEVDDYARDVNRDLNAFAQEIVDETWAEAMPITRAGVRCLWEINYSAEWEALRKRELLVNQFPALGMHIYQKREDLRKFCDYYRNHFREAAQMVRGE